MADRYWVGGNGSWTSADTTHWSATSGGAGGASVPDAATDVHFDTNSTTSVVTLTGALNCLSLICEGTFTGRFTSTGTIAIAGSLTYRSGMGTNNNTGTYTFTSTTTGRTITSAGKTLPGCTFDGVGGGWTLADAVSAASRTWTFLNGAFSTGNQTMAIGAIVSNNSNVRSISLGSSTITLSGVSTAIQFGTTAAELVGLTFNAGTSTIILVTNGTSSNTLRMNGQTYYNFTVAGTSTGAAAFSNSTGNVTFNKLSWTRTNNGGSIAFTGILPDPLDPRAYNVADWDVSGVAGGTIMINSTSVGIAVNLVYTGVGLINVRNLAVRDIAATPANTWFDRGLPVAQMDLGGNTGWIFSARRILTATRTPIAVARTPIATARTAATARTSTG